MGVERALLLQLVRDEQRRELPALHHVAFLDQELPDASGDLRADDDVVGGDDAGEGESVRLATDVIQGAEGAESHESERYERRDAFHIY